MSGKSSRYSIYLTQMERVLIQSKADARGISLGQYLKLLATFDSSDTGCRLDAVQHYTRQLTRKLTALKFLFRQPGVESELLSEALTLLDLIEEKLNS